MLKVTVGSAGVWYMQIATLKKPIWCLLLAVFFHNSAYGSSEEELQDEFQLAVTPASLIHPSRTLSTSSATLLEQLYGRLDEFRQGAMGISCKRLNLQFNNQRVPCQLLSGVMPYKEENRHKRKTDYLFSHLGVFTSGLLSVSEPSQDNDSRMQVAAQNLMVGADEQLTDRLLVGMAIGFDERTPDYGDTLGYFRASSMNLALYGSYTLTPEFFMDWVTLYRDTSVSSNRVDADELLLSSDDDVTHVAASLGSGYTVFKNGVLSVDVEARLTYQQMMFARQKGKLSTGQAVEISQEDYQSLRSQLSLAWRSSFMTKLGAVESVGKVAWQHITRMGERKLLAQTADNQSVLQGSDGMVDAQRLMLQLGMTSQLTDKVSCSLNYKSELDLEDDVAHQLDFQLMMAL